MSTTTRTTRTNRYAGTCATCADDVPAAAGSIYRTPAGPWAVLCAAHGGDTPDAPAERELSHVETYGGRCEDYPCCGHGDSCNPAPYRSTYARRGSRRRSY